MPILQSEGQLQSVGGAQLLPPGTVWNYVPSLDFPDRNALDYAAIYRTQPSVQTVSSFLARNIAQIGLHAFRRISDTDRQRLERGHALSSLISSPDSGTTHYTWLEALVTDLTVFGNYFAVKMLRSDTGALGLFRIPPQNVGISAGNWLSVETYEVQVGSEKFAVPAERMFHLKRHNPDDARWGLSPLESLRMVLNEELAAISHRESFWRNAARHEGVLQTDKKISEQAAARLRAQWQAMYSGAENAGKTVILEEGLQFSPTSFSARDSQYLEARKLTREEVASAYHVSPAMVGILEHANFANIDMQHRMLYQDTLGPWMVLIEEEFERQVLPDVGDTESVYVEFNIAEKLKGSFEEQARAYQAAVGAPWLSRNEARARQNLPPIGGGDELVTPLNVLEGGQASPQDSAPKATSNGHAESIGVIG
jgi:HK97 family phage portal protein